MMIHDDWWVDDADDDDNDGIHDDADINSKPCILLVIAP